MSQYLPVILLFPSCTTTSLNHGFFVCLFLVLILQENFDSTKKFNSEAQVILFSPQTIPPFIFKLFCGNLFVFQININKIRYKGKQTNTHCRFPSPRQGWKEQKQALHSCKARFFKFKHGASGPSFTLSHFLPFIKFLTVYKWDHTGGTN